MASLPPSRSARSSSSSRVDAGGGMRRRRRARPVDARRGASDVRWRCRHTGPMPSSRSRSRPARPTRATASPSVPSRDSESPRWRSSRGFTRAAAVLPASRSMSRMPSSRPATSRRGIGLSDQRGHGVESLVDALDREQRREQPLAQQPRAHRRAGPVEHADQRAGAFIDAAAHRFDQLEVATRHLVERHRVARSLRASAASGAARRPVAARAGTAAARRRWRSRRGAPPPARTRRSSARRTGASAPRARSRSSNSHGSRSVSSTPSSGSASVRARRARRGLRGAPVARGAPERPAGRSTTRRNAPVDTSTAAMPNVCSDGPNGAEVVVPFARRAGRRRRRRRA